MSKRTKRPALFFTFMTVFLYRFKVLYCSKRQKTPFQLAAVSFTSESGCEDHEGKTKRI